MNIFKKDAIWFGMLLGLVIPAILYGILYAVSLALMPQNATEPVLKTGTIILVALFPNLLILRYYLVKLNLDKTGRGMLLSTFILAMVYFVYYMKFLS
ncbi:MAG: hypothetical protein J6Y47_07040 [Bacteroidales bacterium]|nr:hypothetical protein [Bacteroidales bacterium]